jgi:hypothetical protein
VETEQLEAAAQEPVNGETPAVDPHEKALVTSWLERIQKAKNHWKDDFKRMREDMEYARHGADEAWLKANTYYVPIVPRMISLAVASLYARDPKFVSEPTKRLTLPPPLDDPAAVQAAMLTPEDPKSVGILDMLMVARQEKVKLRRFAQTVELLAAHYIRKATPKFKRQMKAMVRRAKTTGVGYLKLDFQRAYTPRPELTQQLSDNSALLERLVFLKEQLSETEDSTDIDRQMAEVRQLQERLQADPGDLAEEGPVFDFPRSTQVIPDPAITSLDGFVGADWVAVEIEWSKEKVEQKFRVDLKAMAKTDDAQPQRAAEAGKDSNGDKPEVDTVRFYEVQDRTTKTVFYVAEGHEGFLRPPAPPVVKLDRFWTIFAYVPNETEHEDKVFPLSDVHALKPTQTEYNSARQALSDHRIASAPRYLMAKGSVDEQDKARIKNSIPHDVIEVNPPPSGKAAEMIEQMKLAPIDPSLYDTEHLFNDALRISGAQQANFGALSGASATESSIAEQSRSLDISSQVDDLDDFLSEFGGALGECLLGNISEQTVQEIVGPGAVWSEFSKIQLARDMFLSTKAGSTGRPNRAAELQNLERAMTWLTQMPSVSEEPLLRKAADLLDIDYDELYLASAPSIAMRNAAPSPEAMMGGDDAPMQQGKEGGNKTPRPSEEETTHRGYPAPQAAPAA